MKIFKDSEPLLKSKNDKFIELYSNNVEHAVSLVDGNLLKVEDIVTIKKDDIEIIYEGLEEIIDKETIIKNEVIGKIKEILKITIKVNNKEVDAYDYIFGDKVLEEDPILIFECSKDDLYYIKLEKGDRLYYLPKKI